jgi:HK97 family phage prohead protease
MADKTPYGDVQYADPGYQPDKKKRYPIDTAEHVRAAWSYINKAHNAMVYSASQLADIKGRIMAAAKKLGVQIESDDSSMGGRSEQLGARDFTSRVSSVDDIAIRSDGSGRIVEAYITPFHGDADRGQEVRDNEGHYWEKNQYGAFTKTLAERGMDFAVLFNHGKTYDGRTAGELMVPIGVPREIEQHQRGVFSATEYLENPLADAALDAVKKGAIRGYSYSGRFMKSVRQRAAKRGELPTITRSEIAMREYGPVLFPAHADASILGTRAQRFIDELAQLDPEDLDSLRQMLGIATPLEPATPPTTPDGAGHAPTHRHLRIRARERGAI